MASGRGTEPVGEVTRDPTSDRRPDTASVADDAAAAVAGPDTAAQAADAPETSAVPDNAAVPDRPAGPDTVAEGPDNAGVPDNAAVPDTVAEGPEATAVPGNAGVPGNAAMPDKPAVPDIAAEGPESDQAVGAAEPDEAAEPNRTPEPDQRPTAEHLVLVEPMLPPDTGLAGAGPPVIALPALRSDGHPDPAGVPGDGNGPAPPRPEARVVGIPAPPVSTIAPTPAPGAPVPPVPGLVTSGIDEPTLAVKVPRVRKERQGRNRLIPRTALGLAAMILAASFGAAFSGVALYSYYQYRLSQTTDKINAVSAGYQKAFANAQADLKTQGDAARAEIAKDLAPLRQLQANGNTLQALVKKVAPSMYFVHTLDQNGQPSVGSAFVVASNTTRSLLLTSYKTVAAATRRPGPDLFVRQGNDDTRATVWTWDDRYDLALIVLPKASLPPLTPAPAAPALALGDAVYAMSGLGGLGGSAVPGVVTDVSAQGIEHTAPVGQAYQGGPLVNSAGQVVAVASRSYSPLNFASDGVWFAPYELSACALVLSCPGGALSAQPGAQRTS